MPRRNARNCAIREKTGWAAARDRDARGGRAARSVGCHALGRPHVADRAGSHLPELLRFRRRHFARRAVVVDPDPRQPGIRHGVLADAMVVQRPNMTKLVGYLARNGLILRRASSEDGRSIALYITAKGLRLLERTDGPNECHEARITAALTWVGARRTFATPGQARIRPDRPAELDEERLISSIVPREPLPLGEFQRFRRQRSAFRQRPQLCPADCGCVRSPKPQSVPATTFSLPTRFA